MIDSIKLAIKIASARFIHTFKVFAMIAASTIFIYQGLCFLRTYTDNTSNWFQPYELHVPTPQRHDSETPGEVDAARPYLFYGRNLFREFDATYTVTVISLDSGAFPVCTYSDSFHYKARGPATLKVLTLDAYIGKHCHLGPGKYRLETTWVMRRFGYWPVNIYLDIKYFEIT